MSYDPKKDLGAQLRFLQTILDKAHNLILQLDTQVNIIIGLSSAIFVFSASRAQGANSATLIVLGLFSALAAVTGLFAIHPPTFMRKKGQREGLFYNKVIISFKDADQYKKKLAPIIGDSDKLLEQYSLDIYNIYKYHYRPKRKLFKLSRTLLITGVIISILVYTLEVFGI